MNDPMRPWAGMIWVEGEVSEDGRQIQRGAVTWDKMPLPLYVLGRDTGESSQIIGTVSQIDVMEDGRVYASGQIRRSYLPDPEKGEEGARPVGIDLGSVEWTSPDGFVMTVTSGKLMAVTLTASPAWPGVRIWPIGVEK